MEKVAIGSCSTQKIGALKEACKTLGFNPKILTLKASSGQNVQPTGLTQTYEGALQRALQTREKYPDCIVVGIESGIIRFAENTMTLDIALVVVIDENGRHIVTSSSGVLFPEEYVRMATSYGLHKITVGKIIADKCGGDKTDPHAILTKGAITRKSTLVDALVVALKQL